MLPIGTYSAADAAVRRIGFTCRTAVDGRRAARVLAEWAQRFALSEPEFQILWCLRSHRGDGLDQTGLAKMLACSAAQISATVEHLRSKEWISQRQKQDDRRRHVWILAEGGAKLLDEMLLAVGYLSPVQLSTELSGATERLPLEAAA
jgi:DNA-binding MarR family transcriptional regulator